MSRLPQQVFPRTPLILFQLQQKRLTHDYKKKALPPLRIQVTVNRVNLFQEQLYLLDCFS